MPRNAARWKADEVLTVSQPWKEGDKFPFVLGTEFISDEMVIDIQTVEAEGLGEAKDIYARARGWNDCDDWDEFVQQTTTCRIVQILRTL